MPEADNEGDNATRPTTPQATPGFFLKGCAPARLGHEEPARAHIQSGKPAAP